ASLSCRLSLTCPSHFAAHSHSSFSLLPPPPPRSPLFPYTTLFRSADSRCSSTADARTTASSAPPRGSTSSCTSCSRAAWWRRRRSEEHTSELQSRFDLVCRLLLEKKKKNSTTQ